jgi:hypothetical protein
MKEENSCRISAFVKIPLRMPRKWPAVNFVLGEGELFIPVFDFSE